MRNVSGFECNTPGMGFGRLRRGLRPMVCLAALAILSSTALADRGALYDSNADGRAQLEAACTLAKASGKRVLVQWGANWCGWCHKLHDYFRENDEAREILAKGYVLVLIDSDHNKPLMAELGVKKKGIPYLSVFDGDGKKLVDQDTGSLETGSRHDPAKVNPFLRRWMPADGDEAAEIEWKNFGEQLDDALGRAKAADKHVLVVTGTQWCGWCRRLEALLASETMKPLIEKNYIVVKADEEKTKGTKAWRQARTAEGSRGVPWYAVVSSGGKVLGTSDIGDRNTGYPVKPNEIEKFMTVVGGLAKHLDAEELAAMDAEVRQLAQKYQH